MRLGIPAIFAEFYDSYLFIMKKMFWVEIWVLGNLMDLHVVVSLCCKKSWELDQKEFFGVLVDSGRNFEKQLWNHLYFELFF